MGGSGRSGAPAVGVTRCGLFLAGNVDLASGSGWRGRHASRGPTSSALVLAITFVSFCLSTPLCCRSELVPVLLQSRWSERCRWPRVWRCLSWSRPRSGTSVGAFSAMVVGSY